MKKVTLFIALNIEVYYVHMWISQTISILKGNHLRSSTIKKTSL